MGGIRPSSCAQGADRAVTPRLNATVHKRVSPTHQPRNHSGVRAYNTYQEHRHNCKRIHKPKWLESIYYHHRWFITEMGAAEYKLSTAARTWSGSNPQGSDWVTLPSSQTLDSS